MLRRTILALAIVMMLPVAAAAGSFSSYGPQLGFSSGPDQFVVGGHLQWSNVAPQLDFAPGVDLGLGDNFNLVSLNGDFHYRINSTTHWTPYVGGGIGLHFASGDGASDSAAGGHFIVGAAVPTQGGSRFFTEMKLGFADSPDFKLAAGWNFRAR